MMCIFGGFLISMTFAKPYYTVADQLQRLESKGIVLDVPRGEAADILSSVTYYRFSGYALAFLDRLTDRYTGGLTFSEVLALYRFDAGLRETLTDALCAVEVTLRTIVSNEFSAKYGPLGYLEGKNFAREQDHAVTLAKIQSEFNRSKQPCAAHFRQTYDAPPLWALADVTTFGSISMLLKEMARQDQNAVSTHYGMRGDILASYMQHATVLRNLCAHHCRVFDFPYGKLKVPPQEYIFRPLNEWVKAAIPIRTDRPFLYQAALVYRLLRPTASAVFDRDAWRKKVCDQFDTLPATIVNRVKGYVDFPADAVASPLWV